MMDSLVEQIEEWRTTKEDEHFEFKAATGGYHFEKLVKYCSALANERGGKMIFGITDKRPRQIVGTQVFNNIERTKAGLVEKLRLRVDGFEVEHPEGRVVVFEVPSRPLGMPIPVDGAYYMRAGEDLVPMTPDMLQRIFAETGPDFSAEVCERATLDDLAPEAIAALREMWADSAVNPALQTASVEQLLSDAELLVDGGITYAALVLLGTRQGLGKHLAQSEIIFEYRSSEAPGPPQQRIEFRQGFLAYHNELWNLISLRNDAQHIQRGLQVSPILTFNERATREAILNAVSHRDYRMGGSVFVRQYARRLEIVSPGGLPLGITPENILDKQLPRNRRVAEVFNRCHLVERSGQGADIMFRNCIVESKPWPDFADTDEYQVFLRLHGGVQDARFARYFAQLGPERWAKWPTSNFLVLDLIHREQPVPERLQSRLPILLDEGVIEKVGRGRYTLARQFHAFIGEKGKYTRRRGLDRETNKELLFKHIRENNAEGSQLKDLCQVLPSLSESQVKYLLSELRSDDRIHFFGNKKHGGWHLGASNSKTRKASPQPSVKPSKLETESPSISNSISEQLDISFD